jgi:hypothetical protein
LIGGGTAVFQSFGGCNSWLLATGESGATRLAGFSSFKVSFMFSKFSSLIGSTGAPLETIGSLSSVLSEWCERLDDVLSLLRLKKCDYVMISLKSRKTHCFSFSGLFRLRSDLLTITSRNIAG